MIDLKKIVFCKCPHCKKHSIPLWRKLQTGLWNLDIVCPDCKKIFKRKLFWAYLLAVFLVAGLLGLWEILRRIGINTPSVVKASINLISMYLVAYHYPLKEKD